MDSRRRLGSNGVLMRTATANMPRGRFDGQGLSIAKVEARHYSTMTSCVSSSVSINRNERKSIDT